MADAERQVEGATKKEETDGLWRQKTTAAGYGDNTGGMDRRAESRKPQNHMYWGPEEGH